MKNLVDENRHSNHWNFVKNRFHDSMHAAVSHEQNNFWV